MSKNKINKYNVVHLSSVHKPFDVRIFHKECKTLAQNGFNVSLIVPHDKDEVVDNIQCVSIKKDLNRFYRMIRTTWRVYRKALSIQGDVYHFHDPELIPVGIFLKIKGKTVIYDVHESVPDQILDKYWIPRGLRGSISNSIKFLEWVSSKFIFDKIMTATETIGKRFPQAKTIIIQNFPALNSNHEESAMIPYAQRPPAIIYMGGITEQRGIKEMVKALALLPNKLEAELHLAGEVVPNSLLLEIEKMAGWNRVKFFGLKPHAEIFDMLNYARIGIALLHPTRQYVRSLPIKLFEYMAAGIPVIASNFPLWKNIIEKHQCGILVDPFDSKKVAQAIEWLLKNPHEASKMGKCGQKAIRDFYHWELEEKKLLQAYREILA